MTRSRTRTTVRWLACVLVFTTSLVCFLQTGASAMLVPAVMPSPTADSAQARAADMVVVRKTLESKVLQQRLHELGYSDKEIATRLGKLSDAQVHQLASRIHALSPGGDFTVIGLLLVVVLVLFIIYLVKRV